MHVFIDAFNNYGVGWFEPFSHKRISFHTIYVADPFFSIWPALAIILLIVSKRSWIHRRKWWMMGLVMSAIYLSYCVFNKTMINKDVKYILQNQVIDHCVESIGSRSLFCCQIPNGIQYNNPNHCRPQHTITSFAKLLAL